MKRFAAIIVTSALMFGGLTGCEGLPVPQEEPPVADVVGTSHEAADALIMGAGPVLKKGGKVIAATFVNIDDLTKSSSFGRIISKQVSSRFTERGLPVIEMQMRNNVYIQQRGGEFLLSRELRNVSAEHNAQAVIVGTYAVGRKNVYVTARLVSAQNNVVLSSYDYTLPTDQDVAYMLRNK